MRLLTVTHFFENHGGGIERVAGHLCRNLAALGHDCEWAASAADPAPTDAAIDVTPLPCFNPTERLTGLPMPIPGPAGFRALARAIDRADVVIVHDALYCTSVAAMMLARANRKPVILFQHIAGIAFASVAMRAVMANATLEYKPTKAGGGGALKMLLWQAPTLLNPHFASGTKDQIASRIFYEPLAGWDKEGNLFPQQVNDGHPSGHGR